MDQNIKDLIDIVEEKNQIHTQYEKTIESLREEINRLKYTIKDQRILIESQKTKIPVKEDDIPSDIKILKDLILSQRVELVEKDKELTFLKEQVENTNSMIIEDNNILSQANYQEEVFEANQKIIELSVDIDNYTKEIYTLKQIIEERETNDTIDQISEELEKATKEIENFRIINEDLEAHANYLQKELDKVNLELNENQDNSEVIDEILKDIEEERNIVSDKIKNYEIKLLDLENEKNSMDSELSQQLEKYRNLEIDYNQLKTQKNNDQNNYESVEKDVSSSIIKELEEEIEILKRKIAFIGQKKDSDISTDYVRSKHIDLENLPKYYQILFLENLFSNISEDKKNSIIDSLIRNLRSKNSDIRRFAVKILRNIKTPKIFNVLKDFINDEEWIIRYYITKALSEFEPIAGLDEIMNSILEDNDSDVKQIAVNYFLKNKA